MAVLELMSGPGTMEGSRDPKLGIIAVRLKCWAPDILTALIGDVPDWGVNGLVEAQPRTFSRSEAGDQAGFEAFVTMEGHLTPSTAEGEEFGFEGTTSEDPVETHFDFDILLDVYGGTEDAATGKATWPKTIGEEGARNKMHGVESWLVPGLIWTRKFVSSFIPAGMVDSLGTIEQPPGNPPELSGGRNWLKVRVRGAYRGNIWQLEEGWMLSGPDGWVPEMYRYR